LAGLGYHVPVRRKKGCPVVRIKDQAASDDQHETTLDSEGTKRLIEYEVLSPGTEAL
jgi:hypothetical protein